MLKKYWPALVILLALIVADTWFQYNQAQKDSASPPPAATEALPSADVEVNTLPTSTPEAVRTPEPTVQPTAEPVRAVIGAVGDIALTSRQIVAGRDEAAGTYDFSESFTGMCSLLSSVDLMCGNLETPLAGSKAGYSNAGGNGAYGRFNAPDMLAGNLRDAGFDVVTTANNHFFDCGKDGVYHTLDVLDEAGLLHTGTYRSLSERESSPLVAEVNGIRVGILAASAVFNDLSGLGRYELRSLVGRLTDQEQILADIAALRAAGAEFILAFIHWDKEYAETPGTQTAAYAEWLLEQGADAILGSHPHVVQPVSYVTVTRPDGERYTGLVAYSMGNFLLRMTEKPRYYGLFVRLTLEKDADGAVRLADAAYLPTMELFETVDDREYHEVLPAYADTSLILPSTRLNRDKLLEAADARAHVTGVCGTDTVPLLEG